MIKSLFKFKRPDPAIPRMDYNLYWSVRKERELPPRVYAITQLLTDHCSVLDIGCGDGELYSYAIEHRKNLQWNGMDISEVALAKARAKGMECSIGDITNPNFSIQNQFDLIIISEVLEHIVNPEAVLEKLRDRFKKALIITVPNISYYKHRLRFLFGSFPLQWQWHPSEHLRFWSVSDFSDLLTKLGYHNFDIISTNGFPHEKKLYPRWHAVWPNLLAEGVIFLVCKNQKEFAQ